MSLKQRSVSARLRPDDGLHARYLSLIVLIPLGRLVLKSATMSWAEFWATVTDSAVVASYKLTFGASLAAALINAVFGFIVAWMLVRYRFRARSSSTRWSICRSPCRRRFPASP